MSLVTDTSSDIWSALVGLISQTSKVEIAEKGGLLAGGFEFTGHVRSNHFLNTPLRLVYLIKTNLPFLRISFPGQIHGALPVAP